MARAVVVRKIISGEYLAHELFGPIARIKKHSDAVARRLKESTTPAEKDRFKELISSAEQVSLQARRLERALDGVTDITQLLERDFGMFDLAPLIKSEVRRIREERPTDRKPVSLRERLPDRPFQVSGSTSALRAVVANLVRNSVEAIEFSSQPRGEVLITLTAEDGSIKLVVEDDGPGIAPSVVGHLFEPFASTKRDTSAGIGLGLYISKAIVEMRGGTLRGRNREGGGAVFEVLLPFAQPD